MASTTKTLLAAKKAAEEEKKGVGFGGTESGMQGSVPDNREIIEEGEGGTDPGTGEGEGEGGEENPRPEVPSKVVKETVNEHDITAAQEVAMASGATEIPTGETALGEKQVHAILRQNENPSEAEVQTRRTEVDTHVTILPPSPTGTSLAADPPKGTLPNSGMILQDTGIMGSMENAREAGLALNRVSDEENEKAIKFWEGEQRRQRMLEGRPRDTDLREEQDATEAPAGGYKSNGILRFANKQGNWVNAVNGYFVPQNDEEKEILDHYVTTSVVESPSGKDSKSRGKRAEASDSLNEEEESRENKNL